FYRHFQSKQALLEELAREQITETPDEFDFEGLTAMGDTRSELMVLARQFEKAAERQRPYLRLIEEVRMTEEGKAFELTANEAMLEALMDWIATKPAAAGLDRAGLSALSMNVFGGWLFYVTKRQQGLAAGAIDRDILLGDWAGRWARMLDE
ncbi:MAG: hypothetical protein R3200_16635, partial [Xanthomonadales bacterium]|nr:hypothetical protein [Xanthomonadales bacterium]